MEGGSLEDVNAELFQRGIDGDLRIGMLMTPVHQQAPDIEAAIRLPDALTDLRYGHRHCPLEEFAAEIRQYYTELAERMERATEAQSVEDRMFM
jgi:uncharacterized protein